MGKALGIQHWDRAIAAALLAASAMTIAACSSPVQSDGNVTGTNRSDAAADPNAAPTIFALASQKDVENAQRDFAQCAEALDELGTVEKTGSVGKTYNAARAAARKCEARVQSITDIRNSAESDFRLSDCREAAWAGLDLAKGKLNEMDQPTAENSGRLETLKEGYSSMAETCLRPDEYMLSRAVRTK